MSHSFNFCQSGIGRYVGFTPTLKAEITRDKTGRRHLEITDRNTERNCVRPSSVVLFQTSAVSVQACKKRANDYLKEAV
jgi:hypothetical protein